MKVVSFTRKPVQPWGCSRARDNFGSLRPTPEKTTCSFPYRFSEKSRNSGLVPGNRDPKSILLRGFPRIDSQIRANRLILANRFRVPELNPSFSTRASGGQTLRIAGLRRFARIARTLWKIVWFFSANRFARIFPIRVANRRAISDLEVLLPRLPLQGRFLIVQLSFGRRF